MPQKHYTQYKFDYLNADHDLIQHLHLDTFEPPTTTVTVIVDPSAVPWYDDLLVPTDWSEMWTSDTFNNAKFGSITSLHGYILTSDSSFGLWLLTNHVLNMRKMFKDCVNFTGKGLDNLNTSSVQNMKGMFQGAELFNGDITNWDVGSVTNMMDMFQSTDLFNGDITNWDVGSVTNMTNMFQGAGAFNRDIGGWNVSNVSNMEDMFQNATLFNQDISGWIISNVTNMIEMFYQATSFNQDLGNWDTASVTNMASMFKTATVFDQDISGWDTASVTDMTSMFEDATLFDQNISSWHCGPNTPSTCNISGMFQGATAFLAGTGLTTNHGKVRAAWLLAPNLFSPTDLDAAFILA